MELIKISRTFTKQSGLLTDDVRKIIESIENQGGNASMIMVGRAVFADIPFETCEKATISSKNAQLL